MGDRPQPLEQFTEESIGAAARRKVRKQAAADGVILDPSVVEIAAKEASEVYNLLMECASALAEARTRNRAATAPEESPIFDEFLMETIETETRRRLATDAEALDDEDQEDRGRGISYIVDDLRRRKVARELLERDEVYSEHHQFAVRPEDVELAARILGLERTTPSLPPGKVPDDWVERRGRERRARLRKLAEIAKDPDD